jgi:hypothetical protein
MKVGKDLGHTVWRNRSITRPPDTALATVPPERLAASDLGSRGVTGRPDWKLRRGVFSQFLVLAL